MLDDSLAEFQGAGTLSFSDPGAYIRKTTCSVEVGVEVVIDSDVFLPEKWKDLRSWVVNVDPHVTLPVCAWAD